MYDKTIQSPYFEIVSTKEEDINAKVTTKLKWKCLKCNNTFECFRPKYKTDCDSSTYLRCPHCNPVIPNNNAIQKDEIFNLLSENLQGIQVLRDHEICDNCKVDIYVPDKKIAVCINDLDFHSNKSLNFEKKYFLNKTNKCESRDIQLVHIFEDEMLFKPQIVKSRLLNLCGKYDKVIYARKCTIGEVTNTESTEFIDKNHIQGSCGSAIKLGLYYDNDLVAMMTFGKFRKCMNSSSDNGEYELLRFCPKLGYHIPGGAGKLFKHFIKTYDPAHIISYADRRWSRGKLYLALGFTLDHVSDPNYFYIVDKHREHRFGWRKQELSKKLVNFDPNLTEYDNVLNNGIDRIFDSGNYMFNWVKH